MVTETGCCPFFQGLCGYLSLTSYTVSYAMWISLCDW